MLISSDFFQKMDFQTQDFTMEIIILDVGSKEVEHQRFHKAKNTIKTGPLTLMLTMANHSLDGLQLELLKLSV